MSTIIKVGDLLAKDVNYIVAENEEYLKKADRQYLKLLQSHGLNLSDVPSPPCATVLEALEQYIYMIVYRDARGYNLSSVPDGVDEDLYAEKYQDAKRDYERMEAGITRDILIQKSPLEGVSSGEILRG